MNFSKRAAEIIGMYGNTENLARLTKEVKTIKQAEKDIELASKNITKILKGKFKRKGKKR